MTQREALKAAMLVKWKIDTCDQGEKCWCRTIVPVKPILFKDYSFGPQEPAHPLKVVSPGEMDKELAEYFVQLHNKSLEDESSK